MKYKNTDVQVEEVQSQANSELIGFYRPRLIECAEALIKAKLTNQPLDFSPLSDLIERVCDTSAIDIEMERHYDPDTNLFI